MFAKCGPLHCVMMVSEQNIEKKENDTFLFRILMTRQPTYLLYYLWRSLESLKCQRKKIEKGFLCLRLEIKSRICVQNKCSTWKFRASTSKFCFDVRLDGIQVKLIRFLLNFCALGKYEWVSFAFWQMRVSQDLRLLWIPHWFKTGLFDLQPI